MLRRTSLRPFALLALGLLAAGAAAARREPASLASQLAFGTKMAQRGLWNEALFRYRQAEKIEPQNARVLNNLAVAYEATGKFEEALATYQRALKIEPANTQLKTNYARFVEFYQGFKPKAAAPVAPATKPAKPAASPSPLPSPAVQPTSPGRVPRG